MCCPIWLPTRRGSPRSILLAHVALNRLKLAAARHLPILAAFYRFFGEADERSQCCGLSAVPGRPILIPKPAAIGRDAAPSGWPPPHLQFSAQLLPSRAARSLHRLGTGLLGCYGVDLAKRLTARVRSRSSAPSSKPSWRRCSTNRLCAGRRGGSCRSRSWHSAGAICRRSDPAGETWRGVARAGSRSSPAISASTTTTSPGRRSARLFASRDAGPLPPYLERANFDAIRDRADRVEVLNRSFTEYPREPPDRDRSTALCCSTPRTGCRTQQLNDLWREITRTARPGARVIFRTAAEPSLLPGRVDDAILERWHYAADSRGTSRSATARRSMAASISTSLGGLT